MDLHRNSMSKMVRRLLFVLVVMEKANKRHIYTKPIRIFGQKMPTAVRHSI